MVVSGLDTYLYGCGHNLLHTSMLEEVIFHSYAKLVGVGRFLCKLFLELGSTNSKLI